MPNCLVCGQAMDGDGNPCPACGSQQEAADALASESKLSPPEKRLQAFISTAKELLFLPAPIVGGCSRLFIYPCLLFLAASLFASLLPGRHRPSPDLGICSTHLKQIAIALDAYHYAYGSFPPAYVADAAGRPLHSWRVLILPFLDQECKALYRDYDFTEPWNSPNNLKLLDRRPAIFACPARERHNASRRCTAYAAPFGPDGVFRGSVPARLSEIHGGNTTFAILAAEVAEVEIPWTKPQDIDVSQRPKPGDRNGFSSHHPGGFFALGSDWSVRFLSDRMTQATFDAMVTRKGSEDPN